MVVRMHRGSNSQAFERPPYGGRRRGGRRFSGGLVSVRSWLRGVEGGEHAGQNIGEWALMPWVAEWHERCRRRVSKRPLQKSGWQPCGISTARTPPAAVERILRHGANVLDLFFRPGVGMVSRMTPDPDCGLVQAVSSRLVIGGRRTSEGKSAAGGESLSHLVVAPVRYLGICAA